ncbi:Sua5/YciO/YrdC/YwlC family protein [Lysobacter yananisis]|uniref:Threonylcarbamoyl-AMP synthase n=1 Tax=Lysobacter yananisis TaxID=1003114 RepID=A0ABY9PD40_9GAMM|nr:Sua5/YciO/YrdC/YwlC family protein [Lysobacter yananisis]WMT04971.1 Sua5/YciO/YrdC/YwlC family protein [Lysobacter yananisis]
MTASSLSIEQAAAALARGGVLVYPTEAVWGIGCDPFDRAAVLRLLAIKQRPVDKGVILIAASVAQFDALIDWNALPPERAQAVRASWPGPHTWALPATPAVPAWISGEHRSVALRVSAHPQAAALCRAHGGPLVSTSANLAGQPPAFRREQLDRAVLALADGVCEGETGGLAAPTPIRVALSGEVLRG